MTAPSVAPLAAAILAARSSISAAHSSPEGGAARSCAAIRSGAADESLISLAADEWASSRSPGGTLSTIAARTSGCAKASGVSGPRMPARASSPVPPATAAGSSPVSPATVATSLPSPRIAIARATSRASELSPVSRASTVRDTALGPRSVIAPASPAVGRATLERERVERLLEQQRIASRCPLAGEAELLVPRLLELPLDQLPDPRLDSGRGWIATLDGSEEIPAVRAGSTPGSFVRWAVTSPIDVPSSRCAR